MIFGRAEEINQLIKSLENKDKSVHVITGEPGIGKSSLLDEVYNEVRGSPLFFIGYYDRDKILRGDSSSLINPFVKVLEHLLNFMENTECDLKKTAISKLIKDFIKIAKERHSVLEKAILQDIVKKTGFDNTFEALANVLEDVKPTLKLAHDFACTNESSPVIPYI
jgi:AAA+ ATPase superfamily predicted ATPase